jgi:hypothetical protein
VTDSGLALAWFSEGSLGSAPKGLKIDAARSRAGPVALTHGELERWPRVGFERGPDHVAGSGERLLSVRDCGGCTWSAPPPLGLAPVRGVTSSLLIVPAGAQSA